MIVVLIPSRGRPENVEQLVEAHAATSIDPNTWLQVAIDNDDPEAESYLWVHQLWKGRGWSLLEGLPNRLGTWLNALSWHWVKRPDVEIVGFMGDDHRPRTVGWDERIREAMQPMGVIYGNDLLQGEALPTAVFLDAEIVRRLGYMVPPGQLHLYLDNFWKLLGERLGTLTYLPDVVIEHVHPVAGKADWDDGYRENNSQETWDHDRQVFERYCAERLETDLEKLR